MTYLRITCAQPGFRRAGIAHAARKIYAPEDLTVAQRKLLESEPLLTVEEISAEEAAAEGVAPDVDVVTGFAPEPRTIMAVMRLLLANPSDPLLAEISTAVRDAIEAGTSYDAFRPIADDIFYRHAKAAADERNTREGRSASGASESTAGTAPEDEPQVDAPRAKEPEEPAASQVSGTSSSGSTHTAPAEAGGDTSSPASREGAASDGGEFPNPPSPEPAGTAPEASAGASGSAKPSKTSTRKAKG